MVDAERQIQLHQFLKELSQAQGQDIWKIVRQHLASVHDEGRRSDVLDMGAGTGIWAYELGAEEAYANVTATDIDLSIAGLGCRASPHDNVVFHEVDFTHALPYDAGSFDVIHIRNVNLGVSNYFQLLERAARILRKGGLLVLTEVELFYHSAIPTYNSANCIRTWRQAIREALAARGVDSNTATQLPRIVGSSALFERTVIVEEIGIPCGSQDSPYTFGPAHIESAFRSLEPFLLEHGYGEADVARLHRECVAELTEVQDRYFQRSYTCVATKRSY